MQAAPQAEGTVARSPSLDESLGRAHRMAVDQGHGIVSLDHLLFALTSDLEALSVLESSRVDLDRLRADLAASLGRMSETGSKPGPAGPQPGADLLRILQLAATAARQSPRKQIDGAIILAAIVGDAKSPAAGSLKAHGLTFDAVIRVLSSQVQPPQPSPTPPPAPPGPARLPEPRPAPPAVAAPEPSHAVEPATQPASASTEDLLASVRARVKQAEPQRMPSKPLAPTPALNPAATLDPAFVEARPPPAAQSSPAPPQQAAPPPTQVPAVEGQRSPAAESQNAPPVSATMAPSQHVQPHPMAIPAPRPQPVAPLNQPPGPAPATRPSPGPVHALPSRRGPPPLPQAGPPPPLPTSLPNALAGAPLPPPNPTAAGLRPVTPAIARPPSPPTPPMQSGPLPSSPPPMQPPRIAEPVDLIAAAVTIPASLPRGITTRIDIRIPRRQIDIIRPPRGRGGIPGAPQRLDPPLMHAATLRLVAEDPSRCHITSLTPETVWFGAAPASPEEEIVWSYALYPVKRGKFHVTLMNTGRTIVPYGQSEDSASSEMFEVKARRSLRRTTLLAGVLLLSLMLGGLFATFGAKHVLSLSASLSKLFGL